MDLGNDNRVDDWCQGLDYSRRCGSFVDLGNDDGVVGCYRGRRVDFRDHDGVVSWRRRLDHYCCCCRCGVDLRDYDGVVNWWSDCVCSRWWSDRMRRRCHLEGLSIHRLSSMVNNDYYDRFVLGVVTLGHPFPRSRVRKVCCFGSAQNTCRLLPEFKLTVQFADDCAQVCGSTRDEVHLQRFLESFRVPLDFIFLVHFH